MRTLEQFLIYEGIKDKSDKVRATGDTLYKTGLKYEDSNYTYDKDNFIEEFSRAWYPGEGESMGAYYIVNYCKKNYNVKIFKATNSGDYTKGEQHFVIAWLPEDSKARYAYVEDLCKVNTAYVTHGGFHNEKSIVWVDSSISSRKDFAKVVKEYIESIFENATNESLIKEDSSFLTMRYAIEDAINDMGVVETIHKIVDILKKSVNKNSLVSSTERTKIIRYLDNIKL